MTANFNLCTCEYTCHTTMIHVSKHLFLFGENSTFDIQLFLSAALNLHCASFLVFKSMDIATVNVIGVIELHYSSSIILILSMALNHNQ